MKIPRLFTGLAVLFAPLLGVAQLSRVPLISTFAGDGTAGYSVTQEGGAAASAQVNHPGGVAVDSAGNVYFADTANHRVRRVDAKTGLITTVAGTGVAGYDAGQDGGAATSAQLNSPASVALDPLGNLYIADTGNHRVRKVVLSTGVITTYAGNGGTAYNQRELDYPIYMAISAPVGVALSPNNDVVIADAGNNRVFLIAGATAAFGAQSGKIVTIAGNGTAAYTTMSAEENVDARTAHLTPSAISWGIEGLYIGDSANHRLRLMTSDQKIKTVAGNGSTGANSANDGATATSATVDTISAIAHGANGQIYYVDAGQHLVVRYQPDAGKVYWVAGNGVAGASTDSLLAGAQLNAPQGVALNGLGDLYIADTGNERIRLVKQTTGALLFPAAPVAGTQSSETLVLKTATALSISRITIAASLGGTQEFSVSRLSGCALNFTLAENTTCSVVFNFSPAFSGRRSVPVTVETSAGKFNFGLSGVGVAPQTMILPGVQSTFAGIKNSGGYLASQDGGPATSAKLNTPYGMTVAHTGDVYIADRYNQRIRKVTAATGIITTFAGNGNQGYNAAQDGGAATSASVWEPDALSFDAAGNLYIAEMKNYRVRRVDGATQTISTVYGDGTSQKLYEPQGVATDLGGNVYIADTSGRRVLRWDALTGAVRVYGGRGTGGGSSNVTNPENGSALTAGIYAPTSMVTDGQGNLYVSTTDKVFKISAVDGSISTLKAGGSTTFTATKGMLIDANDNLIVNTGQQLQYYNTATGELTALTPSSTTGFGSFYSLAGDAAGNLYAGATYSYSLEKLDTHSGAKAFATTAVGNTSTDSPFSNLVTNIGNQDLSITPPASGSNPSIPANFGYASSSTCPQVSSTSNAGVLPVGKTCKLDINFVPQTGGAISGTATLLNDALHASSQQSFSLSGTATDSNPVTSIVMTGLANAKAGTAQTITITAYAGSSVAGNYRGTVNFQSTDARAVLPAAYTFTAGDAGAHTFSVILITAGDRQKVSATDVANTSLVALQSVNTAAADPVSLTATTGTPQSAQVGQQFATGLGLIVKDQYGNGVPDITVTYAAPSTGASASLSPVSRTTDFDGTAVSYPTANSTVGSYSVTANAAGVATPVTFALTNTQVAFGFTLTPINTAREYGQQVRLDAEVTPHVIGNVGPTGSVTFYEGATVLGTVPVQNGVASLLVSGATVGVHQYSASYSGDSTYPAVAKTDATSAVTYTKGQTAVQPSSFTVTVARPGSVTINVANWSVNNSAATGYIKPGGVLNCTLGSYNFTTGGTSSTVPVVDGVATFPVSSTQAAGHYTLRVSYPGDERYLDGGEAKDIDLTVTATPATVTIGNLSQVFDGSPKPVTVTTNPAGLNVVVTYNNSTQVPTLAGVYQVYAAISDPNYTGNASATLNITAGPAAITWADPSAIAYGMALSSTQLNALASIQGTYTFTPAAGTILPPGTHTLSVVFTPTDTSYPPSSKSVTLIVTKGELTVKANNAGRNYGTANPTFTTTVTGAVAGDVFTSSATTAATLTSAPGTYDIVPIVSGANIDRYNVTKVNGMLTITGAATTTTLTSSNLSAGVGTNVVFTATVASAFGTPTGTVEFFSGRSSLGTATVTNGIASVSVNTLTVGTYTITARYAGDGNFASSASTDLIQNIVTPDFSIAVNPTSLTIRRGQTGTAVFTVTPVGGFNGTITFACNSLPAHVICTFAPPSVTPNGSPVSSTLTVNTAASTTALNHTGPFGQTAGVILASLFCLVFAGRARKMPRLMMLFLLSFAAAMATTGCGSSNSNSAAVGSYPISVSAGVGTGSGAHSVNLTIDIVE